MSFGVDDDFLKRVNSPEEMIALGSEVVAGLKAGSVIALVGGLGAGKTHFTKGVAAGLGSNAEVTSPTFSLAHEYQGGRLALFHFDFYRMDSEEEVLGIGWDEYLDTADDEGIIVVEWPHKFPDLLPPHTLWLDFENDGDSRIIKKVLSSSL